MKIYSRTYIKVHAKWNGILHIFYFNLLGAVLYIILEHQFLFPKKMHIPRLPLLMLLNDVWYFNHLKNHAHYKIISQFKYEDRELSFIIWNWSCVLSLYVSNYPVMSFSSLYSSFNMSTNITSIPAVRVTKWQLLFPTDTK